jgi:hypothetical protein
MDGTAERTRMIFFVFFYTKIILGDGFFLTIVGSLTDFTFRFTVTIDCCCCRAFDPFNTFIDEFNMGFFGIGCSTTFFLNVVLFKREFFVW